MPKVIPLQGVKPYNIVVNSVTNSAEITMYGEVVEKRPIHWWTGKPVEGNFIVLNEFLDDLENLSTRPDITIRINSGGGNMNAGVVIYNRLRELSANITTINDGLAASAASIIFLAGDVRKMHPGSIVMIHGAAALPYDYLQEQDAVNMVEMLKAHNQAGINIYVERTGMDEADLRQMMAHGAEGWFTGQQAVDEGFATEVITDTEDAEPVSMKLSPDRTRLMVGGRAVAACLLGKLPEGIPCMTAEEYAATAAPGGSKNEANPAQRESENISNGGNASMEIKNVGDLRKAYPELVTEVENAARSAERTRIQTIEGMQNAVADANMVRDAKFGDNPMTAEAFAIAALTAQAAAGSVTLTALAADAAASGAANVQTAPAAPAEPKTKTDDEKALDLLLSAIPASMKKEGK